MQSENAETCPSVNPPQDGLGVEIDEIANTI